MTTGISPTQYNNCSALKLLPELERKIRKRKKKYSEIVYCNYSLKKCNMKTCEINFKKSLKSIIQDSREFFFS